jgi:hypothetical protein
MNKSKYCATTWCQIVCIWTQYINHTKCSHRTERKKSIREAERDLQTRAGCKEGKKMRDQKFPGIDIQLWMVLFSKTVRPTSVAGQYLHRVYSYSLHSSIGSGILSCHLCKRQRVEDLLLGGSVTPGAVLHAKKIRLEEDKGVSWIHGCGAQPNRKKYYTLLQSFIALISTYHKHVT